MTNRCPFCGNYAYAAPVGDAYRMDCRYCEIQVEITKRAYAARCPNPVAVLDYIREKMKASTRPRVDIADMKRSATSLLVEDQMTKTPDTEGEMLKTAAKAIGTTLGKIAVKAGIASPPAAAVKVHKKAAAKKKTPAAAKETSGGQTKSRSKKAPAKST